ncbi:MAG TPA: FAD-dependent oxidoreductase [Steroidobacteraceae bacterium]|nr:FAD-dependent oxidoreductase [Steroidobacteraceae bacterium]
MAVLRSLWSATAAPGPAIGWLTAPVRAQVAIVGGGYTGLSAALHLGAGGRDVVLLEAGDIGERASGLNGGQVIPGVKHDPDALEALFGPVSGPELVRTVASGPDLVFELIARHGIDCDATRTGWIQPATSTAALAAIHTRVEQWRRRGADVEMLDAAQTARLIGSRRYSGGWIDRRGGTVQPLSYVRGLARAAQNVGARIFCRSPALKLERTGGGWRIDTPAGSVSSPIVILATDAYTDRLVDPLRRTLIPVPSFQVATEPLAEKDRRSILPGGQSASDTWHLLRYFRLDAGGRLVMGSRGTFADVAPEVAARAHYRAVREIFPQLDGIRYEYHWGGLVGMTRDHLPHLHEVAPGLLAGLGYNGRGVAMATVMGRTLANWVLGTPATQLGFPVTALQPIPLHRFNQLGARVAIQSLRALDGLARLRSRFLAAGARS